MIKAIFLCVLFVGNSVFGQKALISTTIYPIYSIVKYVVGDFCDVVCIVPPGFSPHEYLPPLNMISSVSSSSLFVCIGDGLEAHCDFLKDRCNTVVCSDIPEIYKIYDKSHTDPHIWLMPCNIIKIAEYLTDKICAIDPSNKAFYQARCQDLVYQLKGLDMDIDAHPDLISLHNGYRYLAHVLGCNMTALKKCDESGYTISAIKTLKQSSRALFLLEPGQLEEMRKLCNAHNVSFSSDRYITVDSFASVECFINQLQVAINTINRQAN